MGMHPNSSWLLTQPVPMRGGGSHLLPGFGQFSISKWFHPRQRAWLKWLEPSSVRSTWREPRNSESSPLYQEYCDLGWSENEVLQWFLDDLSPFCQRTLQFWSIQTSNFQTTHLWSVGLEVQHVFRFSDEKNGTGHPWQMTGVDPAAAGKCSWSQRQDTEVGSPASRFPGPKWDKWPP